MLTQDLLVVLTYDLCQAEENFTTFIALGQRCVVFGSSHSAPHDSMHEILALLGTLVITIGFVWIWLQS